MPERAEMAKAGRSARTAPQDPSTVGMPKSDLSGRPKTGLDDASEAGSHEDELPPNDPEPDENPLDRGAESDGARADEPEFDDELPPKLLPVPLLVAAELPKPGFPELEELPAPELPVDPDTRGGELPVDPDAPDGNGALLPEPVDVEPPEPDTRGGAPPFAEEPVPTLGGAGAIAFPSPTRGGAPAAPRLPVAPRTASRASPLETGPSVGMAPWLRAVTANPAPVSPARPPPLLVTSVVRCESGAGAVLALPPLTRTGGGGVSRFTITGRSMTTVRGGS